MRMYAARQGLAAPKNITGGGGSALAFRGMALLSAVVCMLVCMSLGMTANAADDKGFIAPSNTTQVWIDIESPEVVADALTGTFAGSQLDFKESPSGVTAVEAAKEGSYALKLKTQKDLDARLVVTFADTKGMVLSASSLQIQLTANEGSEPVKPDDSKPVNPDEGNGAGSSSRPSDDGGNESNNADDPNTNMPDGTIRPQQNKSSGKKRNMAKTGVAVAGLVALVGVCAIAGWMMMRVRGAHHSNARGEE